MGRTIPSYRLALEAEISGWKKFGQPLQADERAAFAELMNTCRLYASDSGAACRPIVLEAIFMAMLVSHQKAIKELKSRLDEPENMPTGKVS